MSAIWGIVNREKPISTEANISESMNIFTFDSFNEISQNNIYLACGHQNFSKKSPQNKSPFYYNSFYISSDCIIYNRDELIADLNIDKSYSDDSIIAEMFLRYGEKFVTKLRGSFSIFIYLPDNQEILLYADHLSRRSIFYKYTPDTFYFSTVFQPFALIDSGKQFKLNEKWISAAYTDCSADTVKYLGETVYEDIYAVQPGHYIKYNFKEKNIENISYWRPLENKSKYKSYTDDDFKNTFITTYADVIKRFLISQGNTGIMLSGGLDSSSVASITAPLLSNQNQNLYSYTQIPSNEYIAHNTCFSIEDETPYIKLQQEMYPNIVAKYINVSELNCFSNLEKFQKIYMQPVKSSINLMLISAIYEDAHNDGCKLMLSGQNGNATISYGSILSYIYQKVVKLHFSSAYKEALAFCQLRKVPKKNLLKVFLTQYFNRVINSKPFSEDCFTKTNLIKKYHLKKYISTTDRKNGNGLFDSKKQHQNFIYMPRLYQHIGLYDTYMSLQYNIISEDPTLTPEIIELCYNMPIDCFVKNGKERRVVRDYFKGYIPNEILDNHTARGSQGADFNFRVNRDWDKIKNQVLEILNEPLLLEYLDKKKIDDLIHTISQNEYNLDKTMVAEATVIGALGYFLRHHAGGN